MVCALPTRRHAILSIITLLAYGSNSPRKPGGGGMVVSAQTQPQPNPCIRWSGQVAIASSPSGGGTTNSTLWYYGGEARTTSDQTENIWTNALVSLDLTKDWPTGTPPLSLVQADNGDYASPPAVALGALWPSADGLSLYQYGGQFSDSPSVPPPAESIYKYDISSSQWTTVATQGDTITRAAEGSAAIVPAGVTANNVGYYFSGHLDDHTTEGWSNQVARIYLNSLVTFDLGSLTVRNITNYSNSSSTSTTSTPQSEPLYRADGTLTFVPNLGTNNEGVLVSIGGATATQYVDNSVLDVYDIGGGGWTKQSTLGDTIGSRISHCAVRATSTLANGVESHQIFVYGGQQLNQTARDSALYILTIQNSTYTWTFVGDELSGQPSGRAGHQCALQGSQLVVMGGLVAGNILCDQPGIYIYDASQSAWQDSYVAETTYQIPDLIKNITSSNVDGGVGGVNTTAGTTSSGSATSSIGNGAGSVSANSRSGGTKKASVGAIAGGVVGGVVVLFLGFLILLLLARRRKRDRQRAAASTAATPVSMSTKDRSSFVHGGLGGVAVGRGPSRGSWSSETSMDDELHPGLPYEKRRFSQSPRQSAYGFRNSSIDQSTSASDDVEEQTRGMETAFHSTLVPRRTLRVTNADDPNRNNELDERGHEHEQTLLDNEQEELELWNP